jgi:uncharacterized protein (DUF302 family)
MKKTSYGIGRTVDMGFDEAVARVKEVFQTHGFGTLTEIDVQATLKEKIGEEIEPYRILGTCNPRLASRALRAEHEIGLLMPCNVLVHECEGKVHVSVQEPVQMLNVAGNEALDPIAVEVKAIVETALGEL